MAALLLGSLAAPDEVLAQAQSIPVDSGGQQSQGGGLPVPAEPAAAPSATQLETVIVTATKQKKAISDVPGSVTAISGADLEKNGAQDMEDVLKRVPGVALNKQDEGGNFPSIRGISAVTVGTTTAATTGIYIDDVPLSDPFVPAGTPDLIPFDLQRVEVLKGPQGTLFGASSFGGAIRYVTARPEFGEWAGTLAYQQTGIWDGGWGPYGAAMVNLPLGGFAAIRADGAIQRIPGYIHDLTLGEYNANAVKGAQGRVQLGLRPIRGLEITASYLRQEDEQADSSFADNRSSYTRSDALLREPSSMAFDIQGLTARYDLGWATLTSVTTHSDKRYFQLTDTGRVVHAEAPEVPQIPIPQDVTGHSRGDMEEIRLSSPEQNDTSWEWVAGFWYQHWRQQFEQFVGDPLAANPTVTSLLPVLGISPGTLATTAPLLDAVVHSLGQERALFGDVTYKFGGHWELTLGGRLYLTTLDANITTSGLLILVLDGTPNSNVDSLSDEKGFNPRVSLRYVIDKDASVYALASKGFQFGGAQLTEDSPQLILLNHGVSVPSTYESSKLWNYEIGARTDWWHRRLSLDATAFYDHWTNLQLPQVAAAGLLTYIANVGHAHTDGIELAVRAVPFRGALISSSATWARAVTDTAIDTPGGLAPAGTRLPNTPKFQLCNVLSYDWHTEHWTLGPSLTHTHFGRSRNDLNYTAAVGNYDTLDARIHLARTDIMSEPDLSFSVKNMLGVKGVANVTASQQAPTLEDVYFVQPRTATLLLTMHF